MKNEYEVRGDTTAIFLRRKDGTILETLIDTADLGIVSAIPYTWWAHAADWGDVFYAYATLQRNGRRVGLAMHRLITDAPDGLVVDHINHDTLDNRRRNLRSVTNSINMLNRRGATRTSVSGVRGVNRVSRSRTWSARVMVGQKERYLGSFPTPDLAQAAVVAALAELNVPRMDAA